MNQLPLGSLSALQAKLTYLVNSILQTPQDLLEYIPIIPELISLL